MQWAIIKNAPLSDKRELAGYQADVCVWLALVRLQEAAVCALDCDFREVRQLLYVLTFDRVKEVEERVVGHLFGNSANGATAFMLLLLLNGFNGHVLPLVPVYLTAREKRCTPKWEAAESKDAQMVKVGRRAKWRLICGMDWYRKRVDADVLKKKKIQKTYELKCFLYIKKKKIMLQTHRILRCLL